MDTRFILETPLMWLDKAQTWQMARTLGGEALLEVITERTHTCYLGDRKHKHEWGYGCGRCPACKLRSDGFRKYRGQ
jgi:7-cyano-7-deazaguanine synthase